VERRATKSGVHDRDCSLRPSARPEDLPKFTRTVRHRASSRCFPPLFRGNYRTLAL
jgi:hypothetical protein